ncbi:hypothetical protein K8Q96_02755 [Candidatus Nomurabacteria bacterium]|jgi:hypothetical protein|nr:hypothetical protein [Candidatus Nomurabacteria bacterium]
MQKKELSKTQTIFLLIIFIIIGGIVLYGTKKEDRLLKDTSSPKMQGPSTPPPGYANPR